MIKSSQNAGIEYGDYSQYNLQMAPMTVPGDGFLPPNMDTSLAQFHDSFEAQFQDNFETNYLSSLPSPRSSTRDDPMAFAVDTIMPFEGTNHSVNGANGSGNGSPSNMSSSSNSPVSPSPLQQHQQQRRRRPEVLGQGYSSRTNIPSLSEIRALNSPSPSAVLPSSPPLFSDANHEDSRRITNKFTTFCSTIFTMHAEIAGVAGVVGEYLTWVRKSRAGAGGDPNSSAVLETLEGRVRELQEMAETRPRDAWETLLDTLKRGTLDEHLFAMMSSFEMEAEERVEKTRRFFQETYDVSFRLPEQILEEQRRE